MSLCMCQKDYDSSFVKQPIKFAKISSVLIHCNAILTCSKAAISSALTLALAIEAASTRYSKGCDVKPVSSQLREKLQAAVAYIVY